MSNEIFRIEHLGKVFNGSAGRIVALDDINLSIREGDIFGIIGLSGAGKSTLVRCLNLLDKPTSGKVIFNGKELMSMNNKELLKTRQSIGMIFQDFNLMAQRNALKNVLYPMEIGGVPKAKAVKRAKELLELVGLKDRMKSYPSQLSGGQKQRVAIARAWPWTRRSCSAMKPPPRWTRTPPGRFWNCSRRSTANWALPSWSSPMK